jgi:CubicO group peptidase (beta-lactamase class C family)
MNGQESKNILATALAEWLPGKLADWKVPGIGVAVVKDGETIFAEGYGLRDREQGLPVTVNTLFAIGSASKAFTAASVALMVDDGKLEWNKPIRNYMPDFMLKDGFATERMSAVDLLCHRSGLPRHDLMWYNSTATREQMYGRLRYLESSRDFRTDWQYQNLMYMTAGYLAGKLDGSSWEDVVRTRIFEPLGMKTANFSVDVMQQAADFALPYAEREDEVKRIDFRNISEVGPAGSINASVTEMAEWVKLQLAKGMYGDRQIISQSNVAQLHSPQMVVAEPLWKEMFQSDWVSYGLGWFIHNFHGETLVQHGGNIDGFSALVSFIPSQNVGVVTLTNLNSNYLTEIVSMYIYETLMGWEQRDWHSHWKGFVDKIKGQAKKAREESTSERKPDTQPTHSVAEYAGEFENPGYGVLTIKESDGKLTAIFNRIEMAMGHYHYNVFEAKSESLMVDFKLQFEVDLKGNIAKVAVQFEALVSPIVFTRMPDASLKNRAFLEQFAGEYELMGMVVKVFMRGEDSLIASVPQQGDVVLEPYMGTTFNLKGLTGFSIEFTKVDGVVTGAKFAQPNGTFSASKRGVS